MYGDFHFFSHFLSLSPFHPPIPLLSTLFEAFSLAILWSSHLTKALYFAMIIIIIPYCAAVPSLMDPWPCYRFCYCSLLPLLDADGFRGPFTVNFSLKVFQVSFRPFCLPHFLKHFDLFPASSVFSRPSQTPLKPSLHQKKMSLKVWRQLLTTPHYPASEALLFPHPLPFCLLPVALTPAVQI